MCITSAKAELSNTKIMSIKLDEQFHLLAYSNKVVNKSGEPNSMILAVPGFITQEFFYDTTAYAGFLKEVEDAFTPRSRSLSKGIERDIDLSFENFQLGIYNVFVSNSAIEIGKAIAELPDDKRPEISSGLLKFFQNHYKGWKFVICCFDGDKPIESQPIMFKYIPFNPEMLFFPGMDSHTGKAPNLNANVEIDHFLISEVQGLGYFNFTNNKVPNILHDKRLYGNKPARSLPNGDWYFPVDSNRFALVRTSVALINNPEYHEADTATKEV